MYRGRDEFVARSVAFVRDGIANGEPVMVAVAGPRLEPLREALGPDADRAVLVDMADLGRNPARIIPAWQEFVADHAGSSRSVRGVGEPIWAGRRPAEIEESQLHEALLNLAIDPDTPLWLLCPTTPTRSRRRCWRELPGHPAVVEGGDLRGSRLTAVCTTRWRSSRRRCPILRPEPARSPSGRTTSPPSGVPSWTSRAQPPWTRSAPPTSPSWPPSFATNSVRHGGGGGVLRWWEEPGSLVVEVCDAGRIHDLLVGRRRPAPEAVGGRGVWLAHQLTDLVRIRSTDDGTVVLVLTHR